MSLFAISEGNRSRVEQNFGVSQFPDEVLVKFFELMEPEELVRCAGVCLHWHAVSSDARFYVQFAQQLRFFCRKEGAAYFKADPQSSFVQSYLTMRTLPRGVGESRFKAIRRYQSAEGKSALQTIWDSLLPTVEDFQKEERPTILRDFPYHINLSMLTACVGAGALEIENPVENRFYSLACFNGDVETVKRVLGEIHLKVTPDEKDGLLRCGILLAVEGRQPHMIRHLKNHWGASAREVLAFNFNLVDFAQNGPYADMAPFLEEDPIGTYSSRPNSNVGISPTCL